MNAKRVVDSDRTDDANRSRGISSNILCIISCMLFYHCQLQNFVKLE